MCTNLAAPVAAGDYVLIANVLHGGVPAEDPQLHTYGFAFDANGDPLDNSAVDPAYPNDWCQDTDRWYEASASITKSKWLRVGGE